MMSYSREIERMATSYISSKLNKFNMKLNTNKCIFSVTSTKFVEHMIINQGKEADPTKIRVVADMPPSKSNKNLHKFNGMIATLNRLISKASDQTKLLIQLLKRDHPTSGPRSVKKHLMNSSDTCKLHSFSSPSCMETH